MKRLITFLFLITLIPFSTKAEVSKQETVL